VFLLTAKTTAQVEAASIARISEEIDAAMPATAQAFARVRLSPQNRSQEHVILQSQRPDVPLPVPSPPELKELRDRYCKKPKLSLRVLT
jgi:DNA-binding IclR family transcriptional regulator